MSVEFIPSSQEFIISSDPEWSVNGWEMDACNVLWRGPRTKSNAFLATLESQKFKTLAEFPRMWMENFEKRNITPNFPGVLINYIGFRSGNIPPVRRVNGTSSQVVTASVVAENEPVTDETVTGQFNYLSSRTTWTWFETQMPPINPRYSSVSQGINPLERLTGWSIPPVLDEEGAVIPIPASTVTQLFNALTPIVIVVDYEREELVPNTFWACRSVVEWRLQ